jgi:hypothetical protein
MKGGEAMKIEVTLINTPNMGPRLSVICPYHPNFPPAARALGGKWDPDRKTWWFDPRDEEDVRATLRKIYGHDGDQEVELVDVEFRLDPEREYPQSLFVFGRQLAYRPARDAPVRLGEGVRVLAGRFANSAGSRRYPAIGRPHDVVLLVRDVPRELALHTQRELGTDRVVIRGETPVDVPEVFRRALEAR